MTKKPLNRPWRPQSWEAALDVVPPILAASGIPLAIGIRKAIYAIRKDGVSKRSIEVLIAAHTSTKEYHTAVAKGGPRYALSGSPDGVIEPSHKASAGERLNV